MGPPEPGDPRRGSDAPGCAPRAAGAPETPRKGGEKRAGGAARALDGTPGGRTVAREGAQVWTLRGHCRLGKAGRGARRWRAGRPGRPQPQAFPRWPPSQPTPVGAAAAGGLCPTRPEPRPLPALPGAPTCLAAERRGRCVQGALLRAAAAPPPSDGASIAPRTGPFPPLPAQLREFEVQQRSGAARPRLPAACGREQCDAERAPRTRPRLGLGPRAPLRGECTRPGGRFVFCFQLGFGIKSASEPRGSRGRAVGERPACPRSAGSPQRPAPRARSPGPPSFETRAQT